MTFYTIFRNPNKIKGFQGIENFAKFYTKYVYGMRALAFPFVLWKVFELCTE